MHATIDRKRIYIFVVITYGLTAVVWLLKTADSGFIGKQFSLSNVRLVLMFIPMIAHIATRMVTREGWSNTFLRPDFSDGRWHYYLAAWLLPFVAAAVGGTVYYLLFPGHFDPMMSFTRGQTIDPALASMAPGTFFITQLGLALITPWAFALLVNLGEEFGWRAYLLPKLTPFGMGKAILLVGVIHGIWHWPSIFQGSDYGLSYWGAPIVGPLLFILMCCCSSVFYTWATLRSGSVWPAVLFHGAFNNSNRLVWIFFAGESHALIGPGAQGIVGMWGYVVLAVFILCHPHAFAQSDPEGIVTVEHPGEPVRMTGPAGSNISS
jgi:membrane protease YdiL (CAAX protease family)